MSSICIIVKVRGGDILYLQSIDPCHIIMSHEKLRKEICYGTYKLIFCYKIWPIIELMNYRHFKFVVDYGPWLTLKPSQLIVG